MKRTNFISHSLPKQQRLTYFDGVIKTTPTNNATMTFNTVTDASTNKHSETLDAKITSNTLDFWRDLSAVPDFPSIHHITAAHK